jgi:hypothetical protein
MLKDNLDYREKTAVDPQRLIALKSPGSAIFSKVKFFDREGRTRGWEVAFMVREESQRIPLLGRVVQVRTGLIKESDVGLIPMLIALGSGDHDIFETWLNFHAPRLDGSKNDHLETLCKQDRIVILLYGESGMERSIQMTNSGLKPTWNVMLEKVSHMTEWEMKDFDLARDTIYRRFPTVRSLWDALNHH